MIQFPPHNGAEQRRMQLQDLVLVGPRGGARRIARGPRDRQKKPSSGRIACLYFAGQQQQQQRIEYDGTWCQRRSRAGV